MVIVTQLHLLLTLAFGLKCQGIELYHYVFIFIVEILSELDDQLEEYFHYLELNLYCSLG
jgi:hypothetical protein